MDSQQLTYNDSTNFINNEIVEIMTDKDWSDLLLNFGIVVVLISILLVMRKPKVKKMKRLEEYPLILENGDFPVRLKR